MHIPNINMESNHNIKSLEGISACSESVDCIRTGFLQSCVQDNILFYWKMSENRILVYLFNDLFYGLHSICSHFALVYLKKKSRKNKTDMDHVYDTDTIL